MNAKKIALVAILSSLTIASTYASDQEKPRGLLHGLSNLFSGSSEKPEPISYLTDEEKENKLKNGQIDLNGLVRVGELRNRYPLDPMFLFIDADAAYGNGDLDKAFDLYLKIAGLGLDEAKSNVVLMLNRGYLPYHDISKVLPVLEELALSGDLMAQKTLGFLLKDDTYYKGRQRESLVWYKKAAEQGDDESRYIYANMLINGNMGVRQAQLGISILKELYERTGHKNAARNIGHAYYYGIGIRKNYKESQKYYMEAQKEGDLESTRMIALMSELGRGGVTDYNLAAKSYRELYEKGDIDSGFRLAALYGKTRHVSEGEATKLLKDAADMGNVSAYRALGDLYRNKYGSDKDYRTAVDWYTMGAEKGDALSMRRLSEVYLEGGNGIAKDAKRAKQYLKDAVIAEQNPTSEKFDTGEPKYMAAVEVFDFEY